MFQKLNTFYERHGIAIHLMLHQPQKTFYFKAYAIERFFPPNLNPHIFRLTKTFINDTYFGGSDEPP